MASLAEMMLQAQLESTDPAKAEDWSKPFIQGAQLAQQREQMQMQRQQLEMQKQAALEAKLNKFADAVENGQKYVGKAQSNYYNKFLPQYKNALGLQDMISDDALAFATATPENVGRFITLKGQVADGSVTLQDAIARLNDPVTYAEVTPSMKSELYDAYKLRLGNEAQMGRTQYTAQAAAQRAREEDLRAGQVAVARDVGKEYAAWEGGGKANVEKNLETFRDAIKKLRENPDLSGRLTAKIPGLGSDVVQETLNPEGIAVRDAIRGAVQASLREVLGAQFTQQEGEAIFNRAFNPRLSATENAKRAAVELKALEKRVKDKENLFRQQGFKPSRDTTPAREQGPGKNIPEASTQMGAPLQWQGKQISLQKVGELLKQNPAAAKVVAEQLGYSEAELRKLVMQQGGK